MTLGRMRNPSNSIRNDSLPPKTIRLSVTQGSYALDSVEGELVWTLIAAKSLIQLSDLQDMPR